MEKSERYLAFFDKMVYLNFRRPPVKFLKVIRYVCTLCFVSTTLPLPLDVPSFAPLINL